MKPYKLVGMSIWTLLFLTPLYMGIFNYDTSSIIPAIARNLFSFIFPAFIFFIAWLISYKRKASKNNFKFYLDILINLVLPYFLCMIPYIIYKYGIHNLSFKELLNIIITGNIAKQFELLKIIIHVLMLLPIAEYFVIVNTKISVIISLIISMFFSVLKLNTFIYTEAFNYMVYLVLGISFSYYPREIALFFRKKYGTLLFYLVLSGTLILMTKFDVYRIYEPAAQIIYNIAIVLLIINELYRAKAYFYNERKYFFHNKVLNPPIIAISGFLLLKIIWDIIKIGIDFILEKIPQIHEIMPILIFIPMFMWVKKQNIKNINRWRRKTKTINPYCIED